MKKFIKSLVSGSDETSHKRVVALVALVVLIGMVGLKAWGKPVDNTLIFVFAGLVSGESVLTVIDKYIKK